MVVMLSWVMDGKENGEVELELTSADLSPVKLEIQKLVKNCGPT